MINIKKIKKYNYKKLKYLNILIIYSIQNEKLFL